MLWRYMASLKGKVVGSFQARWMTTARQCGRTGSMTPAFYKQGAHFRLYFGPRRACSGREGNKFICQMEKDGINMRDSYDAETNAAYWRTRTVAVSSRVLHIGLVFSGWYVRSKVRGNRELAAADLRRVLTGLGPAFVKIAQAVSSRSDLLPPDYLKELEKLQDRLPPFPSDAAFSIIEEECKKPVKQLFLEISDEPVAAASLGQVYKAVLASTAETVAVKVQRPGLVEQIALDVYILRVLAAVVKKLRKLNSDLPALIDEWATSLFRELDYRREAANGTRFQKLFGDMKGVYIPKMYEQNTTARVLVMEWIDGVKLRTSSSGDSTGKAGSSSDIQLVETGVRCSLEQMLDQGFYHADPHPGNLMRMPDGQLSYLDFGMMGEIGQETRQALIRATLHLVNGEFGSLAEDLVVLGFLPPGSNRTEIVPALTDVFKEAVAGGVGSLSFGDLSANLGKTMYEYKFRIPAYYTLLVRSLTVLEGIALASDPNYKVLSAAYPWVARRLLTDNSSQLTDTLRALLYKGGRFQFSRLEALLEQAVKSPAREAILVKDGTDGRPLLFLLDDAGTLVREILEDEVAKGLDAAWRLGLDNLMRKSQDSLWSALLWQIPSLSEEQDKEQIEGILQLVSTLQRVANGSKDTVQYNARNVGSVSEAAAALSWLVQEAQALPPAAREQALRIPLNLLSKVASRVTARAIRNTLLSVSQRGSPALGIKP